MTTAMREIRQLLPTGFTRLQKCKCRGACSSTLGPPDRADRGDRAQVLDQHPVHGESALAEPVGQLVPEVPGSLRRGVARVPEEVDGPISNEVLADGTERRLRPLPEGSDIEGKDLVEAPIAEVRVLQPDGLEHSPARVDVLAVPPRGHLDHLGRAVDRGDRSHRQPLADQGDRDAVATADLEQAVGRADLQRVDRPDEALRCLARHARAIAATLDSVQGNARLAEASVAEEAAAALDASDKDAENQAEGFVDRRDLGSAEMAHPECRSRRPHDDFEGFPWSLLAKEDTGTIQRPLGDGEANGKEGRSEPEHLARRGYANDG